MERKYFEYFSEIGFRDVLKKHLMYLEENGDEGVSMRTFVPASAGSNAPYEFFAIFNNSISDEKRAQYESGELDLYMDLDSFMEEVQEEFLSVLEEKGITKDYPYISFTIGWWDGDIGIVLYPRS